MERVAGMTPVFHWSHGGDGQGPVWYRHRQGTVCGEAEFMVHTTVPPQQCLCGSSGSGSCCRDKKLGNNLNASHYIFSDSITIW